MKKGKNNFKKGNFIDETFGEKIEYVRIFDNNGITLIFMNEGKIVIKKFKNTTELIEKYIEKYILKDYADSIINEQHEELENLINANKIIENYFES